MSDLATSHPPSTTAPGPAAALSGRAPRTALPARVAMRVGLLLLIWGTRPTGQDYGGTTRGDPEAPAPADAAGLRALPTQGWPHPPFIG